MGKKKSDASEPGSEPLEEGTPQQTMENGALSAEEAAALVKVNVGALPLSPYNPSPDGARRLSTSMALFTPADRMAAYRAVTGQDYKAVDAIGKTFAVKHWLCHDIELPDPDTGELRKMVRTVLVTEDGERIATTSDGVLGSLLSLMSFYGKAPWSPPIKLAIKQGRSRAGRTYNFLDLVAE